VVCSLESSGHSLDPLRVAQCLLLKLSEQARHRDARDRAQAFSAGLPFPELRRNVSRWKSKREVLRSSVAGNTLVLDTLGVTGTTTQSFENSFAHRDGSPSLRCLAIRKEDAPGLPVNLFDSPAIEFVSFPHSGIAHQLDDILKKRKASGCLPRRGTRCQQFFL
jgi:hypothetical protein